MCRVSDLPTMGKSPHTIATINAYLDKHEVREKLQEALQSVCSNATLPDDPISAISAALLMNNGGESFDAEMEAAATKLQAMKRGQRERKARKEEATAATRVQAIQRGNKSRSAAGGIGEPTPAE